MTHIGFSHVKKILFFTSVTLGSVTWRGKKLYKVDLLKNEPDCVHVVILVWLDLVLRHINHCRLFNAISFLCIYIYIYTEYMISKKILKITFSNEPELTFFFLAVKWFHLFLSNMYNSINFLALFNVFKYC